MKRNFPPVAALALAAAAILTFTTADASARTISRSRTVTGAHGHSITRSATLTHVPGERSVERSVQTSGGRGAAESIDRTCADGACTRTGTLTTNSGRSVSRTRTWRRR